MAQNRTFNFYGLGYGTEPVNLTVTVAGNQIFSGPVNTVDQPTQPQPTPTDADQTILYTLPDSSLLNTDFQGTLPTTITVNGGTGVVLGRIEANWYVGFAPTAGQAEYYNGCYFGMPVNSDESPDPRSSVQIDGVTQSPPLPKSDGTWNWYVKSGSTITFNWNIRTGQVGTIVGSFANYIPPA